MYHSPHLIALRDSVPAWVLPGASLDIDFANGQAWPGGQIAPLITTSRASVAYADNTGGTWTSFAANVPRITNKGLLVEESRTNDALWCRDCTNAAWTKLNMTAALTATGIDGVANSASTLTATAGNASVLQTITLGSSADTYSVWLKRVSGSGTVNIAIDGVTWTAAAITTTWTRFQTTSTLVNPVFGVQIVTSGDGVAADFSQLEPGSFATSPIATTTAAVARAADRVTVTTPPTFGSSMSAFVSGSPGAPTGSANSQVALSIDDGSGNNQFRPYRDSTTGQGIGVVTAGGVGLFQPASAVWAQNVSGKLAMAGAPADYALSFNGGAVQTGSGAGSLPAVNAIHIGQFPTGAAYWNGYIARIAVWPSTRLSNAQIKAMTT